MTRFTPWLRATAAAFATFAATSCYYDPYASGGGYYDGGGLNTTFVYAGSDRWLYDPAVFCYYDRYRRCYYDPYLYGYYPVGYCPRPIYGAHHPGGWNGHGNCPPPSGYRDRYLTNYQNRVDQLKASNYAWAEKVRERNDATADAWRNQRSRAASNYQASREVQQGRNQQMRETQSQRQQNLRGQQQDWADKTRSQRAAPPQNQRQARPATDQPVGTATASGRGRPSTARQPQAAGQTPRQPQSAPREPQQSAPSQSKESGGGQWKEKMQERKAAREL